MFQKTIDYVKCATRNRFTLAGYTLGWTSLAIYLGNGDEHQALNVAAYTCAFISLQLLMNTALGALTYLTYQRAKKHIKQHETLDRRFASTTSPFYCSQVGLRLAAEEKGLESLLTDVKTKFMP